MAKRPRPSTKRRPNNVIPAAAYRHGPIARKKCQLEGGLLVTLAARQLRLNDSLRDGIAGLF
jgi:hypothetical protein